MVECEVKMEHLEDGKNIVRNIDMEGNREP